METGRLHLQPLSTEIRYNTEMYDLTSYHRLVVFKDVFAVDLLKWCNCGYLTDYYYYGHLETQNYKGGTKIPVGEKAACVDHVYIMVGDLAGRVGRPGCLHDLT